MKQSRTFIPTMRQVPSDADIISHQLAFSRRVYSSKYERCILLSAAWQESATKN